MRVRRGQRDRLRDARLYARGAARSSARSTCSAARARASASACTTRSSPAPATTELARDVHLRRKDGSVAAGRSAPTRAALRRRLDHRDGAARHHRAQGSRDAACTTWRTTTRSPACRTGRCSTRRCSRRWPRRSAERLDRRRPVHRPRPLQERQRHARATPSATSCSSSSADRLVAVRADPRHRRPPRRRRVRPDPGDARTASTGAAAVAGEDPGGAARSRSTCTATRSPMTASIGITIYPDDAVDPETLDQVRRHRDVPGQAGRPRHLPLLHRRR